MTPSSMDAAEDITCVRITVVIESGLSIIHSVDFLI